MYGGMETIFCRSHWSEVRRSATRRRIHPGGLTVHGVEQNTEKVTRVNAGDSYIDDVTSARLQAVVTSGALTASTEFSALKDCEAVVMRVPMPLIRQAAGDK